jgi:hypothetical protein
MYVTVKIIKDAKVLAILPTFEDNSSLEALRTEIEEDDILDGLISFFVNIESGSKIASDEEDLLHLENVATKSGYHDGMPVVEIHVSERTYDEEEENTDMAAGLEPEQKKEKKEVYFGLLKSPKTWELKQLKMYNEDEIVNSRGKTRDYRLFWNRRVQELCKSRSELRKGKITEKINEEWRVEQANLLEREKAFVEDQNPTNRTKQGTFG